jgi:hypothetical protein
MSPSSLALIVALSLGPPEPLGEASNDEAGIPPVIIIPVSMPEPTPEPEPEPELAPLDEPPPTPIPTATRLPASAVSGSAVDRFGPALGVLAVMIGTQALANGLCRNVYCRTRGWYSRTFGIGLITAAGIGGWQLGHDIAKARLEHGKPALNPVGRRATGWTLFALSLAALIADTTLYQLCYDGARGPYKQIDMFRYSCSPLFSIIVVDLSAVVAATGLGLALSAESQLRHQRRYRLDLAPWAGAGQAGLTLGGRF